jgi:hypothetical protein
VRFQDGDNVGCLYDFHYALSAGIKEATESLSLNNQSGGCTEAAYRANVLEQLVLDIPYKRNAFVCRTCTHISQIGKKSGFSTGNARVVRALKAIVASNHLNDSE